MALLMLVVIRRSVGGGGCLGREQEDGPAGCDGIRALGLLECTTRGLGLCPVRLEPLWPGIATSAVPPFAVEL